MFRRNEPESANKFLNWTLRRWDTSGKSVAQRLSTTSGTLLHHRGVPVRGAAFRLGVGRATGAISSTERNQSFPDSTGWGPYDINLLLLLGIRVLLVFLLNDSSCPFSRC